MNPMKKENATQNARPSGSTVALWSALAADANADAAQNARSTLARGRRPGLAAR